MDNLIKIILVVLVVFMLLNYSCSKKVSENFRRKKRRGRRGRRGRKWKKSGRGGRGKKKQRNQIEVTTAATTVATTAATTVATTAATTAATKENPNLVCEKCGINEIVRPEHIDCYGYDSYSGFDNYCDGYEEGRNWLYDFCCKNLGSNTCKHKCLPKMSQTSN
jgi:uncharacterized MAPEG superfamily protein